MSSTAIEDQEAAFYLKDGSEIKVYFDEDSGGLRVCAVSTGTRLTVEPVTNGSIVVNTRRTGK